jgi:hypothetical protein
MLPFNVNLTSLISLDVKLLHESFPTNLVAYESLLSHLAFTESHT